MQSQSYLKREEPIDALCHHFNVVRATDVPQDIGPMFDMIVLSDQHMPTHVLAAQQTDRPKDPPTMLPVDASRFRNGFRADYIPSEEPGTIAPVPHLNPESQLLEVSLPVVPIAVPNLETLPVLLLYGMGLETDLVHLARILLPGKVVGEFPALHGMMAYLSETNMAPYEFSAFFRTNQGLYLNTLILDPTDENLLTVLRNAHHAVKEAHRSRSRSSG